jgi:toxin ParE1/3/4
MRQYVFSKKAEKDLIEIYRYGFLNHDEQKAELYVESLKE